MPVHTFGRTITQVAIDQSVIGQTDLVAAPGAALNIYVVGFVVSLAAAGTIAFNEGTGPTALSGAIGIPLNGSLVVFADDDTPIISTKTANSKLGIVTTGTGALAKGWIRYFVDA